MLVRTYNVKYFCILYRNNPFFWIIRIFVWIFFSIKIVVAVILLIIKVRHKNDPFLVVDTIVDNTLPVLYPFGMINIISHSPCTCSWSTTCSINCSSNRRIIISIRCTDRPISVLPSRSTHIHRTCTTIMNYDFLIR